MQSMKETNLNFLKIRIFCSGKDNVKRMRREATDLEKIFAKDTADKGLLPSIYKELLKLDSQKASHLIKHGQKNTVQGRALITL